MHRQEVDEITAEVLHSAVHDLHGPSNRLRLLSQLINRSGNALDEDTRQLLDHIEDSAAAVRAVAEGLRAYAEICTRPLRCESVDLNAAFAGAMANLQAEVRTTGAHITSSPLPRVQADPFLITWLLQELLTNAIRCQTDHPAEVHVSAGRGGPGGWFVSVVDNGPGIEASAAERVFRPFKKRSAKQGAGLGLTICRNIAERHQGRIWVEPHTGGAEFRFYVNEAAAATGETQ